MKNRPTRIARTAARRRSFAFHPLSFAICVGFCGAASAAPQGGTVVAGQATITQQTPTSQVINQTTHKAIIDWKSFSIASGEKVRFNQPSTTSITLNRVTGYDPSHILGEMSANGKIFLVNPYGVVFGANARVDVGGLVASSLSIANSDFLAGRYNLTSVEPGAPAQRGEVRNEGTISAPGGTVALAGPSVSNAGTIIANGGRVGMAAVNAVSVDVEGDGLLFFQTSASEAKNRLEQLGRIQADGGSIEMRAAARGAFADTVLNMTGVVQARTLGKREGRIVIDGGAEGIVAVSGRTDAAGLAAGERGGSVTVEGQRVLLDNGSLVDASGSAGGGSIRIGGDFHGANPEVRNAEITGVTAGAVVRADAIDAGDGGQVAIWSDGTTRFYGTVSAQGGKDGGNGGFVEVSGKQNLDFRGDVSTLAPKGKNGMLLLDPANIMIAAAPAGAEDAQLDPNVPPGQLAGVILSPDGPATVTISTTKLEAVAAGSDIDLNATNSITIGALTSNVAVPNTLTLGTAGSAQFHAGAGGFSMQPGNTINVVNGSLLIDSGTGPISVGTLQARNGVTLAGSAITLNAPISVTVAGAGVTITGPTTLASTGGTINLAGSNAANDVTLGTVNGAGRSLVITAGGGDITLGAIGATNPLLNVTLSGNTASLGAVTTTGAQNYSGVGSTTLGGTLTVNTAGAGVTSGATVLGAGGGTITLTGSNAANDVTLGALSGAQPLVITAGGGDVTLGTATGLTSVAITASTADLQAVTTGGAQNYTGVGTTSLNGTLTVTTAGAGVSAGATTLAGGGGTIALTGSNAANDVTLGAIDGPSTLDITAAGGDVVLGVVGAGTALAGVTLAATTAALQDVRTDGNQTYNAAVSAAGVTLNAGTGSIAANNSGNDFTGQLTLQSSSTGGVSVRDANALQLAAPTLGANTGLTAIAGGTLTLPNAAISTGSGSIDLRSNGGTLATADTLTTTTGSITMVGSAGLAINDDLNTTSGAVALTAGGAGGLSVTRDIVTTGGSITLTGGAGGLTVSNNRNISAGSGTVVADGGGGTVNFNTSTVASSNGGAAAITIQNGTVTLGNISAANGGVVLGVGQDVTGTLQQTNGTSITAGTLTISAAGAINLDKSNAIANLGGVTRGGAFNLNDVGGLTLTGSVSGGTTSNAVTIVTTGGPLQLGANDVTATTGAGNIELSGVGVSQTAGSSTILAGGTTTVAAGTGSIDLQSATNNFTGNVTLDADGSAAIRDTDALTLAFSSNGITAIAGTDLNLSGTTITTTAAPINLQALGGTLSTTGNLTSNGGAITLVGGTGLTVGHSLASGGGNVSLSGGAAGGLVVTAAGSVAAGSGTITLDGNGSAIQLNTSNLTTTNSGASAVTIRDATTVTLGNIDAATGTVQIGVGSDVTGAVTQTATTMLNAATLAASTASSITLGTTGTLTITNLGAVDRGGPLTISDSAGGLNVIGDIAGGTTNNAVSITAAGPLNLGTSDITATDLTLTGVGVSQTAGSSTILAGGTTTVAAGTGSIDLQSATNNFTGNVTLDADGSAAIRDTDALTLAFSSNGITAIAGTDLNLSGTTITTTAAPINLQALGGTLSTTGNLTSNGGAITLVGGTGLTVGHSLASGGGNVSLSGGAAGGLVVTAAGSVAAGSGTITLDGNGSAIQLNTSNLTTTNSGASAVTIRDATTVTLGNIDAATGTVQIGVGSDVTGAVTQTATTMLNAATLAASTASSITLGTTGTLTITNLGAVDRGGPLTISDSAGGLNVIGDIAGGTTNNAVSITAAGPLNLGTSDITATDLTLTGVGVTQTGGNGGALVASGATTVAGGAGSIDLQSSNNDFAGAAGQVTLTAGGVLVAIRDANDLGLGAPALGAGASYTAIAGGALNLLAGPVTAGSIDLQSGNTLTTPGNLTATSIALTGTAGLTVANSLNATNVSLNSGNAPISQTAGIITASGATTFNSGAGPVTLNQGNILNSVGGTGGAVSVSENSPGGVVLAATTATSLTLTTTQPGAAVTQSAPVTVGGATTINTTGAGAVTLADTGNNFGSFGATAGAVSVADSNAIALDAISATSLNVDTSANGGPVTQNAALNVSGATTIAAGSGAITLNLGNALGSFGAVGGAVSLSETSADGVALDNVVAASLAVNTSAANGNITQTVGSTLVVAGATSANAGTGTVTLVNAGNNLGSFGATGSAVSVRDSDALVLDAISTGSLTVDTTAGNGTLTQTAAVVVSGTTTVTTGTGAITLDNANNDFQGNLLLSGGAVSVLDTNDLAVTSLVSGTNQAVSLIAGGSLFLPPTPIDTGSADLTLQALGGSLVINGALSGGNVTLTGATGLVLGADITSSGDQIYTTTVQLGGNVTLDAGGSRIDLQGGANGGGSSLALVSSNAAANAIHTGDAITNTAQFTVTGNSTLGGDVTTTGNQTYTGPVALETSVALNAGTARIDLQGSVDAAGNALALTSSNAAADAIRAAGVIANASQLTVTGKSSFLTGVTTTGAQLYSDTVTLGSTASFVGSSLGFGNGIVAGTFDLGLRSDSLAFAGTVSGTGNASLSPLTQGATIGVAGGAGTYQLTQTTLDAFSSFGSITVGRADGTGDLGFGNLVLPTNLSVLSSSGDVAFTGTVASAAGQGRSLAVATGGTTAFAGDLGGVIGGSAALGNLSTGGATQLDASLTANGAVSLAGPVTVGASATVSAASVSLGGTLDIGSQALTLLSDSLTVTGPATGNGAGSVRIAAKDAAGSMGIGGAAGTLQVSQGLIDTFAGVPTLTLGRSDSIGTITAGTLTLPTDLTVSNGSGAVAFIGSIDSAAGPARDLTVTTSGSTSFGGTIGTTRALDTLTVSGSSQLGAAIVTSGAQIYSGASTLQADTTLTGPSVSFGSTVDGGRALTVNAAATSFAGAVGGTTALSTLTTDAAGTTQLGGNITTSGTQTYNDALLLTGNAALTGSTLNLAGSVDGARTLAVDGSTGVTLGGPIGAGTSLVSLSVAGPLQLNAGNVVTTGAQSYAGVTALGAASTLSAASIAFGNSLDGGFALTTQSAGTTSFAGAVGATTPLASITAGGGGTVQLSGPGIDTTGAQSYSGALQLTGSPRLAGSALTLIGPVSGATDLTLQTNALNGGSSIAGTGVLTIAPLDPTLPIGVAGGTGSLQVSQAVLDGASGFSGHVVGRADGSGTVTAGNVVLRADTTLQTGSGDINIGSVDGAFALALNSGGTTRIGGPVGATTPLTSLTTDNNATAADWDGTTGERTTFASADGTGAARVITSGAQTYNDPVIATVPVSFSGGAITATQATNRFDGVVSANAISLDLHNSADLTLGTLTLVNGGSLETDGVLHIAGAVQLNGGVLTLTSNATPTPIDLTDPEYAGATLSFGFVPIKEASATIVQDAGGSIGTAAGSMLVLRAPAGGSILLEQPGNNLLGHVSAVSGTLGDNDLTRFNNATGELMLGFLRIVSNEIHVAGRPPGNGDQALQQAGLEGDVIKLTADVLTTGPDGLLRARLPFNNIQGSQTSMPGLTLSMSPTALADGGGFGGPGSDDFIQVQVGGSEGGFLTARPKGTSGDTAVIFLGGDASVTPFYDGSGKLSEIRIFYNGNSPRTPQETGALAAVIALIEDARQARFEEAVRTENVRSRLRSGVIAEVGAGRPATVGRESIRLPDTCEIKPKTLQCE